MYSPTMRVLAVLSLLQAHDRIAGAEIARRLEVDVRTVRRYITMLQDMGVPVEAERGPHGAYRLGRGAQMPPLIFTDGEAIALSLGLIAVKRLGLPANAEDVEGALAKTERVLPLPLLQLVRSLRESIVMHAFTFESPVPAVDTVAMLSVAIRRRTRIHFAYRSFSGDATERDVDPYGIVFLEGVWYTAGYCHLRQDLRTFRLDRMTALDLRETPFVMPDDFDVAAYVGRSIGATPTEEDIRILLRTTLEEAQKVIPSIWGTLEEISSGVLFRPSPIVKHWMPSLLLWLDMPVEIIAPASLRMQLYELSEKAQSIAAA